MAKISKEMKALKVIDTKFITDEAIKLAKETSTTKFDSTVELSLKYWSKKSLINKFVEHSIVPAGTGKTQKF